jgi:beta-N-acetylhexosaminidase
MALAAVAVAALVAGMVVGSGAGGEDGGGKASGGPSVEVPSCPDRIASSRRRLVGQMLIVRMEATATDALRERLAAGAIGGVVLFPPEGTDPDALGDQVAALRRAAGRAAGPPPLVAIDQEGGEVERLPGLPPGRSPAEIATGGGRAATAEP